MLEGYRTGVDRIPKEVCVNGVLNDKRAGKIGFRGEMGGDFNETSGCKEGCGDLFKGRTWRC